MDEYESLNHTKWECKHHVVFIPKCRRKTLLGQIRQHLGEVFRKLAVQRESRIEKGHLQPDHVHLLISHAGQWTVALRNAAFFAYADNYLMKFGIIVNVESSRAIR